MSLGGVKLDAVWDFLYWGMVGMVACCTALRLAAPASAGQGNRTPHTDPLSRGAITGLTLKHGRWALQCFIITEATWGRKLQQMPTRQAGAVGSLASSAVVLQTTCPETHNACRGHVFRALIEAICYGTELIFETMQVRVGLGGGGGMLGWGSAARDGAGNDAGLLANGQHYCWLHVHRKEFSSRDLPCTSSVLCVAERRHLLPMWCRPTATTPVQSPSQAAPRARRSGCRSTPTSATHPSCSPSECAWLMQAVGAEY